MKYSTEDEIKRADAESCLCIARTTVSLKLLELAQKDLLGSLSSGTISFRVEENAVIVWVTAQVEPTGVLPYAAPVIFRHIKQGTQDGQR